MHAVVVHVSINDAEAAAQALRDQVVPRVSQAPGFVAGYWVGAGEGKGVSLMVFETEEQARGLAGQVQSPGDAVTFDSIDVGEVEAHA
jgi:hypothetical protein